MKRPPKCASKRGKGGVLLKFVIAKENDPLAVLMGCKTGTVGAKVKIFFIFLKKNSIVLKKSITFAKFFTLGREFTKVLNVEPESTFFLCL